MYLIDEHAACAVAGITADANILINQARLHAQRYRFNYQEPQPVEQAYARHHVGAVLLIDLQLVALQQFHKHATL